MAELFTYGFKMVLVSGFERVVLVWNPFLNNKKEKKRKENTVYGNKACEWRNKSKKETIKRKNDVSSRLKIIFR